ncbi:MULTISPECIES: CBS domain-containing protein [Dethiosulfovibrio]|uniref:CBS domain-containing protein n=2 Tax=Dethiosulfovibrio TaxID=47054 RepID=A0ABS9ENQ0_9BACT|nr:MULTISPECIES: CBS domain-containing protein [Dethiosulfovibrio]MCF4113431.1 CBS domain-containing protein [Dethiosulfovibrio russensis]MCF4141901.1 CBS domain-containing protein [Dethiosulfovibrio marinus]MCF4144055.1 CBS domain-containing protein [Dethiosulfovibrio acidaminovorans]
MKVITSHVGSDFDSLASMIAAGKLYPDGVPCFSGSAERNVRDFLKRHRDRWTVLTPRKIRMDEVTQLIVVDTRSVRRLGVLAPLAGRPEVDVHVYDHHPPCSDEIDASKKVIEPVGAAVTLILEEVLRRGIAPTPHEATLFALGIYEDTGGLIFGGTTKRDYEMMCRMREYGADFTLIPSAIEMGLSASERSMMDKLVENAWERYIAGARVVFTMAAVDTYIEGLSLFVHRLRDFFSADVVLSAVRMEGRTYVVGRSKQNVLDVSSLLKPLGGGGHPQAASATVSDRSPQRILLSLENKVEELITPVMTVSGIMTSPVMAVDEDSSVNDAYRIMLRYGHSALPVTRRGDLIGLITRKDLDKAQLHGYGEAMVGEFMTEGVITVSSQASIEEAHRSMVTHNIGRLPVVRNGDLIGIVTRTDLLRALYPASMPMEERQIAPDYPWTEPMERLLDKGLSCSDRELLKTMGRRAHDMGMAAYVVGGVVRDLLLDRPVTDLDVVVEGDATGFIKSWERDGADVSLHGRFKTGTIAFPDGRKVDVATARREFYEFPTAQPTVSSDSLKHDLYRRDFTVNAMALSIGGETWGTLIDYFGGRRDILSRKLRTLHNLSFVEDPTRIFRGVRLEQRLGFDLDDNALRTMKNCVRGGLFGGLSGFRLRSELEISLKEPRPWPIVKRMAELGLWEPLFPGIHLGNRVARTLRRLSVARGRMAKELIPLGDDLWIAPLAALLQEGPDDLWPRVADRLNLGARERSLLRMSVDGLGGAEEAIGGRSSRRNSEIVTFLRDVSPVVALYWALSTARWRFRRRILLYLTRLIKVKPMLSGSDILAMGYSEGPHVGKILDSLLLARLDGTVDTRDDEIAWVTRNFKREVEMEGR